MIKFEFVAVIVIAVASLWLNQWLRNRSLQKELHYQREAMLHQEQVIVALQEDLRNVQIKQKHSEVARSISDDVLRERMQHEGYYRD